jgi:hypothetical protein
MKGKLLKGKKINYWLESSLLAKTLNKTSLSTSKSKFAIDIQEHLKD